MAGIWKQGTSKQRSWRRIVVKNVIGLAACALLVVALSRCSIVQSIRLESQPPTYGRVADAVPQAVPRVVSVQDLDRRINGLGHAFSLELLTDSPDPFTPDQLDAVVETIWRELPWEPNSIEIVATTQSGEAVDLGPAAEQLGEINANAFSASGVSLSGVGKRYGDWTAPED